jgi:hypothetical protein
MATELHNCNTARYIHNVAATHNSTTEGPIHKADATGNDDAGESAEGHSQVLMIGSGGERGGAWHAFPETVKKHGSASGGEKTKSLRKNAVNGWTYGHVWSCGEDTAIHTYIRWLCTRTSITHASTQRATRIGTLSKHSDGTAHYRRSICLPLLTELEHITHTASITVSRHVGQSVWWQGYGLNNLGFKTWQGQDIFLFNKTSRSILGPTSTWDSPLGEWCCVQLA